MVKDEDGALEGYVPDLMRLLTEYFPINYELRLVRDNKYGALQPDGKTWNGMIGELINKVGIFSW